MNKNELKKIYKYDDVTGRFVVEIALDYYLDLFNAWDAAPIKKRDLDPELLTYLEDVAEDIPLKEKLVIVFVMQEQSRNEETEKISRQVFVNYFNYLIHLNHRNQRKSLKQAIYYVLASFTLVALAYLIQIYNTLFVEIVSEGFFIGGWVFMWEAISILVFKSSATRRMNKRYLRFAMSDIEYEYR